MDLLSVQRGEFGVFCALLEHEYFVCTDAFKKWLLLPLNGKICRERAALDFVFSFGKSSLMVGGPSGGSGSDSKVSLAAHQNEAALVAHADSPMRLAEGSLKIGRPLPPLLGLHALKGIPSMSSLKLGVDWQTVSGLSTRRLTFFQPQSGEEMAAAGNSSTGHQAHLV